MENIDIFDKPTADPIPTYTTNISMRMFTQVYNDIDLNALNNKAKILVVASDIYYEIASNEYNKTYIKVTDNGKGTYSPIYTSKEGGKRRSRTRRRKAKAKARKSRRSRR